MRLIRRPTLPQEWVLRAMFSLCKIHINLQPPLHQVHFLVLIPSLKVECHQLRVLGFRRIHLVHRHHLRRPYPLKSLRRVKHPYIRHNQEFTILHLLVSRMSPFRQLAFSFRNNLRN